MIDTTPIRQLVLKVQDISSPNELSEVMVQLRGWYARLAEELENILVFKPERLMELRKESKSGKEAEWAWKASEEGKTETRLSSQMNYIDKLCSSINARLRVKDNEARGHY